MWVFHNNWGCFSRGSHHHDEAILCSCIYCAIHLLALGSRCVSGLRKVKVFLGLRVWGLEFTA